LKNALPLHFNMLTEEQSPRAAEANKVMLCCAMPCLQLEPQAQINEPAMCSLPGTALTDLSLASPGASRTPGRHSRSSSRDFAVAAAAARSGGSFAESAGSPRVTPRHTRTSSIEALANAASFVQPYKARILYGAWPFACVTAIMS
jgi:hypothetical protein